MRRIRQPEDTWTWTFLLVAFIVITLLFVHVHARGDVPEERVSFVDGDMELPTVRDGNRLLISPIYVASLNPETKFADWVVYRLTPAMSETENVLVRNWRTEHRGEALEDSDYNGSGYDRGHLVPLESVSGTRHAWHCNRLEVIAPQRPDLNRGPWLALERHVRQIVRERGEALVSCGTLYRETQDPLPDCDEPHRVPSHFWLIVSSAAGEEAYVLPQRSPREAPFEDYRLSDEAAEDLRRRLF